MPDSDELVALPSLIAALLMDMNRAFRKANAEAVRAMPVMESGTFRLLGAEVEMEGRAAKVESGGLLFFPTEQTQKGSAFKIKMPIQVNNPPPEHPWELAGGLLVVDEEARRAIYKAAIKAIGFLSMETVGDAPIWRIGPGEYLVLVRGNTLRAARVAREGSEWTGESLDTLDALWGALSALTGMLADRYGTVLGKIE